MKANVRNAFEPTRITVDELQERMTRGEHFTILDNRNPAAWVEAEAKLPGVLRVPSDEIEKHLDEVPRDRVIITYCT